jgi:hypothetical protein
MVKMNKRMAEEFRHLNFDGKLLSPKLSNLLSDGFVAMNGCIFLKSLSDLQTNATQPNFPDKTGYECFVNSIHIDDYVDDEYVVNACLFLEALFKSWRQLLNEKVIRAIVAKDEFSTVVKFHIAREGETWIAENIERNEDAILVAESTLIAFR